jgi:hypothetical protein
LRVAELARARLYGRIDCVERVSVLIDERFAARRGAANRIEIRATGYTYHAWLQGDRPRDLLRYDSAHGLAELHKHGFDLNGNDLGIQPVALEALPWVDEIVREAVALAREQRGG